MKRHLSLATVLLTALTACTAPNTGPNTGPTPTPQKTVITPFKVTLTGLNTAHPTGTARLLRDGALKGQATDPLSPDLFEIKDLFTDSFTDTASGTRHIRATLSFKYLDTVSAKVVTLNPLNTDLDNDPNTVTPEPPTIRATPFSSITYFDGSDASEKAESFKFVQGKRFDALTGKVSVDPAASVFRAFNVGFSGPVGNIPGLVCNTIDAEYDLAPQLGRNFTRMATLAVDVPLDSRGPAHDPFEVTVILTMSQQVSDF